jgi:outer membrane protein OmpA-like peptidoglycan-associated protein
MRRRAAHPSPGRPPTVAPLAGCGTIDGAAFHESTPMSHDASPAADSAPRVIDRADADRGLAGRVVPLVALAALAAFIVQSCLTEPSGAPAVPRFDAAAAESKANAAALAALAALPADAPATAVLAALNLAVVNFATGSSDIPASAGPLLDAAGRTLAAQPADARVVIYGHTDNVGVPEANLALSVQRAEAVRAALVARGVPAERLNAIGQGDRLPIASNATEEGRFRNRRIEFALPR